MFTSVCIAASQTYMYNKFNNLTYVILIKINNNYNNNNNNNNNNNIIITTKMIVVMIMINNTDLYIKQ